MFSCLFQCLRPHFVQKLNEHNLFLGVNWFCLLNVLFDRINDSGSTFCINYIIKITSYFSRMHDDKIINEFTIKHSRDWFKRVYNEFLS